MRHPDRAVRASAALVAALVIAVSVGFPAAAQSVNVPDVDPGELVNVEEFSERAREWGQARQRMRAEAIARAGQLARETKAKIEEASTTTTAPTTTAVTTTTAAATTAPTTTAETTTTSSTTTTTTSTTTTAPPSTTLELTEGETEQGASAGIEIPAGTTEEQWHALRECESNQNYQALNPTGQYRGAYQFSIRTWNWVAGMHYLELEGVDPADASSEDQDKMAYKLYEINGWNPWPTCKKRLSS